MITFDQLYHAKTFEEILTFGEELTANTDVPQNYYKSVKLFFEEPQVITKYNKAQIVNVLFNDGDIVTYIVKYNKIFQNKVYRLSNIPYSQNNIADHVIEILDIIFTIIPSAMILMYEEELIQYSIMPEKKIFLPGYENYYYQYDAMLNTIKAHKNSRNDLNKYLNHGTIEYHNIITDELITRMKNIFHQWFSTHPEPNKNKEKLIQELLLNNPYIFILKFDDKDIGCIICAISNTYCFGDVGFDLCRMNSYPNATLFLDFFICQYLKEQLNINTYFIGGYVEGNTSLRKYKDKWSSGKINTYGLNKNYFNDIINIILERYE